MDQDILNQTIKAINETIAKNRALLEQLTSIRSELASEPAEQETSEPTIKESLTVETSVVRDSQTAATPQELFPEIVTADLETVKRKCRYIIDTYGREQHRQPLLDLVKYHAKENSLTKATPMELQRIYDDVCKYDQNIGRDKHE